MKQKEELVVSVTQGRADMNYRVLYLLILIIFSGCSEKVQIHSSEYKQEKKSGRYDYTLGEALRQKYIGQISDAAALFEKCTETDPDKSVPYYELAQIYASVGEGHKALKNAITAAELDKKNYWYQMAVGSLYLQYNSRDSALVYLKRANDLNPGNPDARIIIADIYSDLKKATSADSVYEELNREGMLNDELFLRMIAGLVSNGKIDEAAKRASDRINERPSEVELKAILADIYIKDNQKEKGDSIYNEIIKEHTDEAEYQLLVLNNLIRKKEYESAAEYLKSVFKSDLIEKERKVILAKRLVEDSLYVKDQYLEIDSALRELEFKYPLDEEILSFRPLIYEELEIDSTAIEVYEDILAKVSPGFYFKEKLIILYNKDKLYNKLYNLCSVYSKENNRSLLAKVYFGISAMELEKYDIAEEELKKALILAGNENDLQVSVLSILSEVLYRQKKYDNAISYLEKAEKIKPDDILVLNNYAYYLAETGKELDKALKMAEKVMRMDNGNPTYIDTYAWVLYKMRKYKKAFKVMRGIFEEETITDSELNEHMGYIMKEVKGCDEALRYWEDALRYDSSKKHIENEISKCKELKK